jgi:hypothetical protein
LYDIKSSFDRAQCVLGMDFIRARRGNLCSRREDI